MAVVTSSFAGPLPLARRHHRAILCVVISPPIAAGAWASAGSKALLRVGRTQPPLLSLVLGRQRPAAAADSYYDDDHDEGGGEGGDEGDRRVLGGAGMGGGRRAEEAGRRLYVGNLPYWMTPSQLAEVFAEAGTVASVEVVYDRLTDRSRGFAFITMGSAEDARSAIRMFDGAQVGGRTAKVNLPEVPRGGEREVMGPRIRDGRRDFVDSPHKLYAGNLSWIATSDSLRTAFAPCPGLLAARVVYDRDTGRSRGYGFVSFASADDARSALDAMDGVEVEGRPLRVSEAHNTRATGDTITNSGGGNSPSSQVLLEAAQEEPVDSAATVGWL